MANPDAGTSGGNAGGGKYQVFLNFCGQDTRSGFTDFLYQELVENYIHVFMDDEKLPVGEEIGGKLLQAINDSQIYIPIFSRNYASSKWCLRELVKMVNNISKSEEKKILPIFYDVEPKDVDLKPTSLYITAIEEHKKKFPDEGESWEGALQKIDKIKGWKLEKCKSKADLMKLAVREVLHRLKSKSKIVANDLVGLDGPVREVLEWLDVNCSDVRLLGIYGMGGIGKTTLAKVIYNKLHSRFEKCCAFLDEVRETSKKEGLLRLQKNLITEIVSSDAAEKIKEVDYGRVRIEETLGRKEYSEKVPGNEETPGFLIVLDDVDEKEQIENLIGQRPLQPGTRVIITTRNTSVKEFVKQRMAREMKEMNSDHALPILSFEMKEMDNEDALQLFSRHAFPLEGSLAKDFDNLSKEIVSTTKGLPLALRVVGSLLCGKPKAKWEKTLKQLMKIPHKDVQKTLMISYKELNYRQREIFLDIACFFINEDMKNANYMWEACGFYPNVEIDILVEMSLINIKDNKFWMHDQLRDLGREIVCQESPTILGRRSRLWTGEEVFDLVRTKQRKEKVEAIDLRGSSYFLFEDEEIKNEEIERFENLRFLRLSNGTLHGDFTDCLPMLKWFSWSSPLPTCNGVNMHLKNLVVLEFFENHFKDDSKVWDSLKMATKLKSLTLVDCFGITRTPDLSECQDLERLTFDHCKSLEKFDDSIGKLKCLLDLNITTCELIERVPNEIGGLVKLEHFSLNDCHKVRGLPTSIGDLASLRKLDLSYTGITSLPESIKKLRCLSDLRLKNTNIRQLSNSIGKLTSLCTLDLSLQVETIYRWELPQAIGMLVKLEELYLGGCKGWVGKIPDEIGRLSSLRVLDLSQTKVCRVPKTINMLSYLSTLDLTKCDAITKLPKLPKSLVHLRVTSESLQVVPNLSNLTNIVELVLSDGYEFQVSSKLKHTCDLGWIDRLPKLKKLKLCLLNIAVPPTELGALSLLEDLTLLGLNLQPLEQLPPSLRFLKLDNFSPTGPRQSNLKIPSNLELHLSRLQEIQLHGFSQLQQLKLTRCDLQRLSIPSSLRELDILYCPKVIEIQVLGMSASLVKLVINGCQSIRRVVLCGEGVSLGPLDQSESSSSESTYRSSRLLLRANASKKLEVLLLWSCENLGDIQVIGTLLSLQHVSIELCDAMEKLTDISNLKNLCSLSIRYCFKLRVVEGLDKLEFLTRLHVDGCPRLETLLDISNSKISDECEIFIFHCGKSIDSWDSLTYSRRIPFKRYKEVMVQRGAPQSETNKKKAKMEGDAKEPNTELPFCFHPFAGSPDHYISEELPWFHPFAGCQDHYISEELPLWFHQFPPIDNVKEGTLPGNQNQNQTRQQDLNPLSISPSSSTKLQRQFHSSTSSQDHEINEEPPIDDVREGTLPGNQNQTREQDSNLLSNSPLSSTELQLQFHPSGSRDHEINQESPIDDVRKGTLPGNQNQTREQDSNPQSNSPLSSTELQLQFHPSTSSQDHEINEEPPIDDVREGTPPGNQNQTREQDSNPQSNSPLSSIELQLQFHPSGSRDHEINQECPIDDVREGTLPGNQNQTREQDSNPQSNSPLSSIELQLQFHPSGSRDHEINEESPIDDGREGTLPGNQNRTREPDSKPQSLDELARPRTFSDSFKACLVSILECVCNGDFT